MTATFEVARVGTGTASHLNVQELAQLRAHLEAELEARTGQLADHATAFVELRDGGEDVDGVERELVGIHATRVRGILEEVDYALDRFARGTYGTCECCERSIPFERLEVIPRVRFCVACPPPSAMRR